MQHMQNTLEYDDVLLVPLLSSVNSRSDVDISVRIGDTKLKFPLVASPMRDIVDNPFLQKLSDLGGMGFLHRFYTDVRRLRCDCAQMEGYNYGTSIKLNSKDYEWMLDYNPNAILIDIANGYISDLHKFVTEVKNYIVNRKYSTSLIAGCVAEGKGAMALEDSGADVIRVGIGNGSVCSTRNVTGVGVSSVTSIEECSFGVAEALIMADGGIKTSGDFVKAIGAGADFGMAGKLFSETYESPAETTIFGMASRTNQEGLGKTVKSVEGFDISVTKKHSLEMFMDEFGYGIKSAGTYLNARTLDEIRNNAQFIRVTSSAIKRL